MPYTAVRRMFSDVPGSPMPESIKTPSADIPFLPGFSAPLLGTTDNVRASIVLYSVVTYFNFIPILFCCQSIFSKNVQLSGGTSKACLKIPQKGRIIRKSTFSGNLHNTLPLL